MNITMLCFEDSLRRLIQMVMEEGVYTFKATRDPTEAFRMVMESAKPCVMLTDNFEVSPIARKALPALRANPALRQRVRVISVDIKSAHSVQVDAGLVDDFVTMPITVATLLETIEANIGKLPAQ